MANIQNKYYQYGEKEIQYLKERDPVLGRLIDEIGRVEREVNPHVFSSLISSIIGQQISTKAAITVESRLVEAAGGISPENLAQLEPETIQGCGLSWRKVEYIRGITEAALSKTIDFNGLHRLTDEEVIRTLTSLRGVGEWTAEMLLLHSLQRPDILSYKDLGIRRGIMLIYGLEELSKKDFQAYRERYSPYGTVASLYIWEAFARSKE